MASDPAFAELMARLQAGDQDVATEVFHRFARRLIGLARGRLDDLMRQKVDPEDVLQSVYRSFFLRHAQGQYELESWDSLWAMLTLITVRKCGHQIEHFRAACRDVQREVKTAPDLSGLAWEAVAREPTPSQATQLAETVEALMNSLVARERDMLALSLQGYSPAEISAKVGRTERTVQRVLKRVRAQLEQMRAADG